MYQLTSKTYIYVLRVSVFKYHMNNATQAQNHPSTKNEPKCMNRMQLIYLFLKDLCIKTTFL